MAKINWCIKGKVTVHDWMTPSAITDEDGYTKAHNNYHGDTVVQLHLNKDPTSNYNPIIRPLAGIEVIVYGATKKDKYKKWDKGLTGAQGNFTVNVKKSDEPTYIKVKIRFDGHDLYIGSIIENVLGNDDCTIYESQRKKSGPTVDIGSISFDEHSPLDTNCYKFRVRAVYWYVVKSVIKELNKQNPDFSFKKKISVSYPGTTPGGASWADGINRVANIRSEDDNLITVLHEIMHLWNYDHNTGTSNWIRAVQGDNDTAGYQEDPNIAFHEGFAEYAGWELAHLLWYNENKKLTKGRPYNRKYLYNDLNLTNLSKVEKNWLGVVSGLRFLTFTTPSVLKIGTKDTPLPSVEYAYLEIVSGCPMCQLMNFWDVLKIFLPHEYSKWKSYWEVGKKEYGIKRFFDRASDLIGTFDDDACEFLLKALDPNKKDEPYKNCKSFESCEDSSHNYLGNRRSREVHNILKENRNCQLNEIKHENKKYFEPDTLLRANNEGYDNCHWCIGGSKR